MRAPAKVPVIIHFIPSQSDYLRAEAERLEISRAELVRRMVDLYRSAAARQETAA